MTKITVLKAFYDNFIHVIHSETTAAVIDPGTAEPVLNFVQENNLTLEAVLLTHNHSDHSGGAKRLKTETGCQLIGAKGWSVDKKVKDNDTFTICNHTIKTIEVPGHTSDDQAYYIKDLNALFTGDTMFACGCGRLFGGTSKQMHNSLQILASYPDNTKVYCGHEYTEENCKFALTIDIDNPLLHKRLSNVKEKLGQGLNTVPSILKEEKDTNPFLRCGNFDIRKKLNMVYASDAEVFAEIRKRKNRF